MTTYSFDSSLQMTEFFENAPFYNMNSSTTWDTTTATPFYYESSTNTLNFGYGINLTGNANNSAFVAEINSVLIGLGITLSADQWEQIASHSDLSDLADTLNDAIWSADSNTPSVVQTAANSLSSYYYTNDALTGIQGEIATYNAANPTQQISWNGLSSGIQAALLDLQYNTNGTFLGTVSQSALLQAIAAADMESVAYELAYNTFSYAPSSQNEARALVDAAQALGFDVEVDGNYNITNLTPLDGVSNSTIAEFLQGVAQGNSTDYPSSTLTDNFISNLNDYTVSQGFYIPQSGDTASTIANLISDDNGVTISSSDLTQLNADLGGDLGTGGMVYLPTSSTSVGSNPISPADLPANQTYYYDANNNQVYTVGPNLDGSNTGNLIVTNSNDTDTVTLDNGTWTNLINSDGEISATIGDPLNPSGYLIFNPATGMGEIINSDGSIINIPGGSDIEISPDINGGYDVDLNGNQIATMPPGGGDGGGDGNGISPGGPGIGGGGPGNGGNEINNGNQQISPLVLDLTGDGLNLTPLSSESPYFDLTNDGFARKTGWIGSGTGLLVLPNSDGSVTSINNLFGNQNGTLNGFQALGFDDSNSDGVINSSDPIYSQLRVWVDGNGNGVVDSGELYTLADLGITSINLTATSVDQTIAGNTVKYTSTFTYSDGTTGEIADVWFSNSPTYTQSDTTVTISSTVAALPELKGYGVITDLQSAMMNDSTLEGLVQNFVALSSDTDAATIASDVQAIMYEWGNATNPPIYYGTGTNSNQIAFLDNYTGVTFTYSAGAGPRQTDNVDQAWTDAFAATEARLVLQSSVSAQVPEFVYDASLDAVLPVNNLSQSFADAYTRLGDITSSNLSNWELEDQVAYAFQMDANVSQSSFEQAIAAGSNDTIASVANAVANDIAISFATDGSIVETGVNTGSVFYAGAGISEIVAEGAGDVPPGATNWQTTNDIINYNAGDGTLEISGQGDPSNTSNTLSFGAGITASDIVVSQGSGNNVVLTDGTTGDQITLDNMLTTNYDNGLYTIQFADGTSWTSYQLDSMVWATGSATHTSLTDGLGNATFDSKGYAHHEDAGLTGNNTFIYDQGYGSLEISDRDETETPNDVLKFGAGISASQLTVTSDAYGDMFIGDGISGDQIELDGMLNSPIDGVQQVQFADGTSLTKAQLVAMANTGSATNTSLYDGIGGATFDPNGYAHTINAGLSGNNTFLFNEGYGSVEIQDEDESATPDDVLRFGAGVSASRITVSSDAYGDMLIGDGTSGDQIELDGMLNNHIDGIEQVQFADGTTLSKAQLLAMVTTGTATNTSLTDNLGGAVFDPAGYAHTITSGGDGNTFIYNAGYGDVEISEADYASTPDNVLQLGSGISPSQISLSQDAYGTLYLTDGTSGDQIKIDYMLSNSRYGVQQVRFADGTTWDTSTIQEMLLTEENNVVNSGGTTHYESESGTTNNTFVFNSGYGALEISEYDYGSDPENVLQFGTGITPSQITVSSDAYGDLLLGDGTTGDQVKLDDMLGNSRYGVQQVQFANGTIWTEQELLTLATTGSATNTSLYDALGNAAFDPAGYAHTINASSGTDNTFLYNSGYGAVAISEYDYSASPDNVLKFGTGITPSQITVSSDAYGDLLLGDGTTGDQVKLDDMLGNSRYGVQQVQFANGTTWSEAQLITMATTGSPTNTSLYDALGNATFDPAGYAHTINAGSGTDNTFIYNSGYGAVSISEYDYSESPDNVLEFGSGISSSQVTVSKDAYGDLILGDEVTGDQVTLDDMLDSSRYGVQQVQFAGGATWSAASLTGLELGTSGNDTVTGTSGNDTFYGSAGTDTLNGGGGYDTYKIGTNIGSTTINNSVSGGTAASGEIDFLAGISDENLWFQQSGNNLQIDLLGTTSQITVSGWFGSNASAQVESINAGGVTLDSQVSALVSAMATYAANNTGFNPATATAMPTDSTLQTAIASAWHA